MLSVKNWHLRRNNSISIILSRSYLSMTWRLFWPAFNWRKTSDLTLVWCRLSSRSAHRTPNFTNPEYFACLLFEYFYQIKVLNAPKNANLTYYIKKKKHTLQHLKLGKLKFGARWRDLVYATRGTHKQIL